jgi:hypothetical protein
MQTIPTIRKLRRKPQPTTRCAGGFKRQNQISTSTPGADGFLTHSFLPLCNKANKLPEQQQAEFAFFKSAESLCKLHGFGQIDVTEMPYPYNILLTQRDLETKLNRQPYETELFITRGKNNEEIALAMKQVYEVGNTLYYIPVIPLYRFLRLRKNKACGQLLLAVMSYLYREAGVPYYRDEGSYMYDEYEMNKEYFLECMNENPDDYEEDMTDIIKNDLCGDIMQRKIHNPYHLEHFAETIEAFKPQNSFEEECLLVAKDALALYLDFPRNSIFQHIEMPEDEDGEYEAATPETYISFIGDCKGWVYENIERQINDVLGNYSEMAIPNRVQVFDGSAAQIESLEFEYRLFELIEELCNILFDLP